MKKNLVPLLGIAFVVAIVATGIFYGLFVGRLKTASAPGPSIVVAARNLDRGASLQAADVKLTPWGGAAIPEGALTAVSLVDGLTLIASMQENEPVLQSRLASRASGAGAGLGIAPGMRAVSIHATDSSGIVSLLRPGHRVDVQLVLTQSSSLPELRTILQNIEVLSVAPSEGRANNPVVTLLVNPEGADMAGQGGSRADLRPPFCQPPGHPQTHLPPRPPPALLLSHAPGAKK